MPLTIFAKTQTGDLVETAGVVTGVANVEQSFTTGLINEFMSGYNGGKTFTTGMGKTVGTVLQSYVQGIPIRIIANKLGKDPYPFLGG